MANGDAAGACPDAAPEAGGAPIMLRNCANGFAAAPPAGGVAPGADPAGEAGGMPNMEAKGFAPAAPPPPMLPTASCICCLICMSCAGLLIIELIIGLC